MTEINPTPVGTVESLVGKPLRASVTLPPGEQLADYEVQVAEGHVGGRGKAWDKPIWKTDARRPIFETIDDFEAFEGMIVRSRRPEIVVRASEPIDAYTWVMRQDGKVVDSREEQTSGISPDGMSVEFVQGPPLRRTGMGADAPRSDAFYPPIESHLPGADRGADTRIKYTALTHSGHSGNDAFAVDFNWGNGADDRNHWVRAAAAGRVVKVIENNGQVHIRHRNIQPGVEFETVYAHMGKILVEPKQQVRAQDRIGRIGSQYHDPTKTISPHLHHQHLRNGTPIKMRLLIHDKVTEIGVSRENPGGTIVWKTKVPGWIQARGPATARLALKVRRVASGKWSDTSVIRFRVAGKDETVPPEQEARFKGVRPADIKLVYRGEAVEPGEYTVRYQATGDAGTVVPWVYDKSIVVEPVLA